jgi:phosphatidylglycerophosphate synthase
VATPASDEAARGASDPERWLAILVDPPNRFWRYPAARFLLRLLAGLPLRPNHITLLHGLVGQAAAALVAFGGEGALPAAFALLELRGVLDCYDGVLARAKKLSSPYGRALDELSDGLSFVAVNLAIVWRVHAWWSLCAAVAIFAMTAVAAWAYDFFRRKLAGALERGSDTIVADLRLRAATPPASGLGRLSHWLDQHQVRLFSRHSAEETFARVDDTGASLRTPDVERILAAEGTPRFTRALRALSLMSGDNAFTLLGVGLLFGRPVETQVVTLAYDALTLVAGIHLATRLLREGRA